MSNSELLKVADLITIENNLSPLKFIGEGNLWVIENYNSATELLVQSLIMRAIQGTALGQLQVYGYDKSLSGIFSPFSPLTDGENGLFKIFTEEKELNDFLIYLKKHIHSVQNVIQGQTESLTLFRKGLNRAVESYKLVVLNLDISKLKEESLQLLKDLLRNGPAAGVSFIIIGHREKINHDNFSFSLGNLEILNPTEENSFTRLKPGIGENLREIGLVDYRPITTTAIREFSAAYKENQSQRESPTITFQEIHPQHQFGDLKNSLWKDRHGQLNTTIDGLTFSLGMYGQDIEQITIGDEVEQRHNILITGAVGQGKSNVISVIIHSLAMNYSPEELSLYLLDFKEGVSLKAYTGIDDGIYLPHANALALESDVNYGLSMLQHLFSVYKDRMKLFKSHGVKSLKEYRNKTGQKMARLVVIIDEFQLMFGDDNSQAEEIASLLEKSVRLFRASGIHFILASQSISGNMALMTHSDQIFSQVPIRIAHKNSATESQRTLGMGNLGATTLNPHEAIVNLDYGLEQSNRKVIVAYADDQSTGEARKTIFELAQESNMTQKPRVFDSEEELYVNNSDQIFDKIKDSRNLVAVGKEISIDSGPATVHFNTEFGENLLILGAPQKEVNAALGILQGVLHSLKQKEESFERVYIFNFYPRVLDQESKMYQFLENISQSSPKFVLKETADFEEFISNILSEPNEGKIFVLGIGMDHFIPETNDPYNAPMSEFMAGNSLNNVHFIGWWTKTNNLTKHVGEMQVRPTDVFNTRILLNVDQQTVQQFTAIFVNWELQDNRAMLYDSLHDTNPKVIIPFSPLIQEN